MKDGNTVTYGKLFRLDGEELHTQAMQFHATSRLRSLPLRSVPQ
jgi:hypothetical protein